MMAVRLFFLMACLAVGCARQPAPAEPARATESLEATMDETLSKPDFPDVSATGDDFPNAIERSDEDRYN